MASLLAPSEPLFLTDGVAAVSGSGSALHKYFYIEDLS